MKHFCLLLVLLFPGFAHCQYQYGFLQESFFGRLPSARAEAMGNAYASVDGDLTTVFFNPAGAATIKGLEVNGSFTRGYYLLKNSSNTFLNLGFKVNNYLVVGLSRNHFSHGFTSHYADNNGNFIKSVKPFNSNYTLTLASQPIKNLYLGLNTNYFIWNTFERTQTLYFDFGAIKKIPFLQKDNTSHSVNLASSITNLNFAKLRTEINGYKFAEAIPVIVRYAANYQYNLNKGLLADTLQTFRFLLQTEYKHLLNSKYNSGLYTGIELMFLDLISLRGGYYTETANDFGQVLNYSRIHELTYGLGIQAPLYKISKLPLNINFDYTNIPQAKYYSGSSYGNYTTYNVRLNWAFK